MCSSLPVDESEQGWTILKSGCSHGTDAYDNESSMELCPGGVHESISKRPHPGGRMEWYSVLVEIVRVGRFVEHGQAGVEWNDNGLIELMIPAEHAPNGALLTQVY